MYSKDKIQLSSHAGKYTPIKQSSQTIVIVHVYNDWLQVLHILSAMCIHPYNNNQFFSLNADLEADHSNHSNRTVNFT